MEGVNNQEIPLGEQNLLEMLRSNSVAVFPQTDGQYQRKMELIIEHRSKFPSKLRPTILEETLLSATVPDRFLLQVYKALRDLFARPVRIRDSEIALDPQQDVFYWYASRCTFGAEPLEGEAEWHGLDSNIDTEEEIEIVIRLFPLILDEEFWSVNQRAEIGRRIALERMPRFEPRTEAVRAVFPGDRSIGDVNDGAFTGELWSELFEDEFIPTSGIYNGRNIDQSDILYHQWILATSDFIPVLHPANLLLSCTKSIAFLPLFIKLGTEFRSRFTRRKHPVREGLLMQLLFNRSLLNPSRNVSSVELDESSLAMLEKLIESNMVKPVEFENRGMMQWFLRLARDQPSEFVKRRLKVLINWNPYLLLNLHMNTASLLCDFLCINQWWTHEGLAVLSLIIELGILHYPDQIGFVFHRDNYQKLCIKMGLVHGVTITENQMAEMIRDFIIGGLRKRPHHSLPALVISVANNRDIDSIHPDGLYTLIRSDPMEALMLNNRSTKHGISLGLLAAWGYHYHSYFDVVD